MKFPDKSEKLKGKYCLAPFETVMINEYGEVYLCGCPAWLPTSVGNINNDSIYNILNNDLSQQIRDSIIDHSYTFCNEKACKVIKNNELLTLSQLGEDYMDKLSVGGLKRIFFAGDRTCNLSCPSCRTQVFKYHDSTAKDERDQLVEKFVQNLFSSPNHDLREVVMSTSGELFASEVLLKLLERVDPKKFPQCMLHIQTNGLLMKTRWHRLGQWQNKVGTINLTADACTKNKYELLRRGGKFESLLENLEWLKDKKAKENISMIIPFLHSKVNIYL